MESKHKSKILEILTKYDKELLEQWVKDQLAAVTMRKDLISDAALRQESTEFLRLFREAIKGGNLTEISGPEWKKVREMLSALSKSRADMGFTTVETSMFIFSFKQPLLTRLSQEHSKDAEATVADFISATTVIDKLGLFCMEEFLKTRESVITRQQKELLELSTPVVKLWKGILTLPLIGTLDSERTQVVMESLLQMINDTGSEIAIIDITGVPTVDTLVAQHLMKTVAAARLMGAECLISGISPQIAQTIVHLGVRFGDITTKATLADAFALALKRLNLAITVEPQKT